MNRAPLSVEKPQVKPESNAAIDDLRRVGGPSLPVGTGAASGTAAPGRKTSAEAPPRRISISRALASLEPPPSSELSVPALLQAGMTWRPAGGAISASYSADKPVMRHQILALQHRLQYTMAHADKLIAAASAGEAMPVGGHPILDGDFAQCRSIAGGLFSDRCLPAGAAPLLMTGTHADEYTDLHLPSSLGYEGGAEATAAAAGDAPPLGGPGAARFRRRTILAETVALDASTYSAIADKPPLKTSQMELALVLFEHKWVDLTLAELEQQVSVACSEHGSTLHLARLRLGSMLSGCLGTALRLQLALEKSEAVMAAREAEVMEARRSREDVEAALRRGFEMERMGLEKTILETRAGAARQIEEANAQVESLTESLKALTSVFKRVKGDDDLLRVSELREMVARLERKLAERTQELEVLLPLKAQLRSAEREAGAARDEAARLAATNEELRVELERCRAMNRVLAQKTTDAEVEAAVERARATEEAAAERAAATAAAAAAAGHAGPAPVSDDSAPPSQPPLPAHPSKGGGVLRSGSSRSLAPPGPGGKLPQLTAQPSLKQLAVSVRGAPPLGWGVTVTDRIVRPAGDAQLPPQGDFLCARCNASVAEVMAQDAVAAAVAKSKNPFAAQSAAAGGGSLGPNFALPWLAQASQGDSDAAGGGGGPGGAPHVPCLFYRLLLPALPPVPPDVLAKIQAASEAVLGALSPPHPAGINAVITAPFDNGGAAATAKVGRGRGAAEAAALAEAVAAAAAAGPVAALAGALPFPSRPVPWLRWCMRAILISRLRDDAWLVAGRPEPPGGGAAGRRVRMPEYVYAWFGGQTGSGSSGRDRNAARSGGGDFAAAVEAGLGSYAGTDAHARVRVAVQAGVVKGMEARVPVPVARTRQGTSSSSSPPATADSKGGHHGHGHGSAAAQAPPPPVVSIDWGLHPTDEARWAFYFGLRQLAREDPEAKLFYALLDERNGEDELTFLLYALCVVDAGGLGGNLSWGPTAFACDFHDCPAGLTTEELVAGLRHRAVKAAQAQARSEQQQGQQQEPGEARGGAAAAGGAAVGATEPPEDAAGFGDDAAAAPGALPPDSVWVPLPSALQVTARVLSRAPASELVAVLQRVRGRSVAAEGRVLPAHASAHTPVPASMRYLRGLGGTAAVSAALYDPSAAAAQPPTRGSRSRGGANLRTPQTAAGGGSGGGGLGEAGAAEEAITAAASTRDEGRCIDLFLLLRIFALEYREEQARRRGTIRMMFTVALSNVAAIAAAAASAAEQAKRDAADRRAAAEELAASHGLAAPAHVEDPGAAAAAGPQADGILLANGMPAPSAGVTPRQFAAIIAYVHPAYPPEETAALYRDAFTLGRGTVNFDSFTAAAEARQFFSSAMRLPPLIAGASAAVTAAVPSPLTREQCAAIAFSVDGHWKALEYDLSPWLAQLPPGWLLLLDRARSALAAERDAAFAPTPFVLVKDAPATRFAATPSSLAAEGAGGADSPGPAAALAPVPPPSVTVDTSPSSANASPDGRRMLVAYRAYLDLLRWSRGAMRASRGEAGGPRAVLAIEWELRAAEETLRRDAAALAPDVASLRRLARMGVLRFLPAPPAAATPSSVAAAAAAGSGRARAEGVLLADSGLAAARHFGHVAALRRLGTVRSPLMPGAAAAGTEEGGALAASPSLYADAGALHAEDIALRLGLDVPAGDPILQLRSHEAADTLRTAAQTACLRKLRGPLLRALWAWRERKVSAAAVAAAAAVRVSAPPAAATGQRRLSQSNRRPSQASRRGSAASAAGSGGAR